MPKTVPITGGAGKWGGGCQTGGWGRQAMRDGTTQPIRSEDPWAQVGLPRSRPPSIETAKAYARKRLRRVG